MLVMSMKLLSMGVIGTLYGLPCFARNCTSSAMTLKYRLAIMGRKVAMLRDDCFFVMTNHF